MKNYILHVILYTFLITMLGLSLCLNSCFIDGVCRMDTERIRDAHTINELYGDDIKAPLKKR